MGVQNHLMYMGFVPQARVKALHRAPAGDPTVYSVEGIEIALRRETARAIHVSDPIPAGPAQNDPAQSDPAHRDSTHRDSTHRDPAHMDITQPSLLTPETGAAR